MAKKVKCVKCECAMSFAVPRRVTSENYNYAKHVLEIIKNRIYCGETSKTKPIDNEQYCKHYCKRAIQYSNERDVKELEKLITEYESAEMKGE